MSQALQISEGFQLVETKTRNRAIATSGCTKRGMVQHLHDHRRGFVAVKVTKIDAETGRGVEDVRKVRLPPVCSPECLAQTFYHSRHPIHVRKVQRAGKVRTLFQHLLYEHGEFLLVRQDEGGYHKIRDFKILHEPTAEEVTIALAQVQRMAKRTENATRFSTIAEESLRKIAGNVMIPVNDAG